jgi:hypothetical protein
LTAAERAAIDTYGLFNLKDLLPKKPGETELRIIKEMFEASVDGQTYDADRWGQYYKPPGSGNSNPDADDVPTPAPTPRAAPTPKVETAPWEDNEPVASAPVVTETAKPANPRAEEILAMIRNRKS